MNDANKDINESILKQCYNTMLQTKKNKISQYILIQDKEVKLSKEENRAYIINLCFENIIKEPDTPKNYFLANILFENSSISENLFEKDKLSQIYKTFENNFIKIKAKEKKEKEKLSDLFMSQNKPSDSSLKSTNKNEDLQNINLQIRFLSKIYYLYSDKKDMINFTIKEILDDITIEDKNIIIKEFMDNKNNFERKEFATKEEAQFYIRLFLEINSKNILRYSKENNFTIEKISKELKHISNDILYIKEFWNIFNIQTNQEIIHEMCAVLYQLYYSVDKDMKELFIRIKDVFQYNIKENRNIISVLKYVINQSEKDFVVNIKPHYLLCKKIIIKINVEEEKGQENNLYFFGNTSINQIYHYLTENNASKSVIYYTNNEIMEKAKNKSLNEFEKKALKISKKEIENNISVLSKEKKLTERFNEVLKNWFNFFSKGKQKMTRADLAECFNALSGKKKNKFTEKSNKVYFFLKKNSDSLDFILLDNFIKYYYFSITQGNEKDVWMNIENMNLRNDLSEIPKIKDKKLLPRYYLSNEIEEKKDLYLMNIFKEKYKTSLNKDVYDFMFFLSTEEKIYDEILKNYNSDPEMKFNKRQDEYLYNLYIMNIIESIFEDVEYNIIKNKLEYKVGENDYKLYKPENNIDLKNTFFVEFIKNNYSDLIEYSINNLEKMISIKGEKADLKSHYVAIILYQKNLEMIFRIYNYYNNIYPEPKKGDNIITFGQFPLKEFIENNNLTQEIKEQVRYYDIFVLLMQFLEMYCIKENENKELIQGLIDAAFYLFISLLYNNELVFEENEQDSENSELLRKIINFILAEINKKKKNYLSFLIRIKNYRDEILLFLIEQSFNFLKDINQIEAVLAHFIANNYILIGLEKESTKKKVKKEIITVFNDCLTDEDKNKKSNAFVQLFMKLFNSREKILNEILEEKINECSLFDIIYDKMIMTEKKKLKNKYERFDDIQKIIAEENNDKFINYDVAQKKIEEIFKTNNIKANDNNNSEPKENIDNIKDLLMKYFKSYIISNTNNKEIMVKIISDLKKLIEEESKKINDKDLDNNKRIKKSTPYVGLRNLGALCYINSTIQQLFWIPKFRHSILSANDSKPKDKSNKLTDDDNILHQTQKLFTYMTFSSYGEFIPKDFVFSISFFGERIQTNVMLDSSEFYLHFCDLIKTALEKTEYKYLIEDIFCGKIKEKKICSECKNVTYKEEEFKSISLEVKDMKDIFHSLDKYFSEEVIDDYKCDKCNNKVKLKKFTLLSSLPNTLVFHLKKIIYNNKGQSEKINSKYDFPLELDIKKYCIENTKVKDEYYKYRLRGINIHKGNAEGGHYLSLIQTSKEENKWYLFDDSNISEYDFANFEEEFNKEGRPKSAFMLYYESVQEKETKTEFKENTISKEYLLEVFKDNKNYEYIYGTKIIDLNNNLMKIMMNIIEDDSFKIMDKKLSNNELKDLLNIFIDLIIGFYSDENNKKNPEQKDIKNIVDIINKIFLPLIKDSYNSKIHKQIKEKLFSDKNIILLFINNKINELNEKLFELIQLLITENKKNEFFEVNKFIERTNKTISNKKNITIYLYKILYESVKTLSEADLQKISSDSFLDLYYKTEEETEENLEEIFKVFDYFITKKNLIVNNENTIKVLKEDLKASFFIALFDKAFETLINIINKMQNNDEETTDKFNMNIIPKLYSYCLKEKDEDKIRKKQVKLMKLIFYILDIKDKYIHKRTKVLLGFPSLVMQQSDNILTKFGVNILNNNINNELYEYLNYNLKKKNKYRCVLAYLFPSCYNDNEEIKLKEKDKCDLIYELITRSLGLNGNEGNYFLFKTLYLMQTRSIKYDNLYQEMKSILEKAKNNKYELDKIKKVETEVIKYINYEVDSSIKSLLGSNKYESKEKPKVPEIYSKGGRILYKSFNKEFIGCISDIFPNEIGKIEIKKNEGKNADVLMFKFYTTYLTKNELTSLSKLGKSFSNMHSIKDMHPNTTIKKREKTFSEDYSVFKAKKDLNEMMSYIIEKLKENQKIVIKNKEILNKYEVKNTFNRYYLLSKNKRAKIKAKISYEKTTSDEIKNFYLPEYIFNAIEENPIINLFNVHVHKNEFEFCEMILNVLIKKNVYNYI